jgi:hypothetical protein
MLKSAILGLVLVVAVISASVPCTQYQATKQGTASDCSIVRIDTKSISWGAKLTFNTTFTWTDKSFSNVLADMGSPRLPISPSKSDCTTKAGSYKPGDSVLMNCTQVFDTIPTGYSNVASAFDGSDYPLGFSMKIPLGLSESLIREE